MTDRERLIDTLDEIFAEILIADGSETERILAALEAAGYAWYRPEDCEGVTVEVMNVARRTGPIDGFYPAGSYRLVPVGGDS